MALIRPHGCSQLRGGSGLRAIANYGTDPSIEIDNAPQDFAAGRDTQLEKSLDVVLKLIETCGGLKPNFGPRPSRRLRTSRSTRAA
jgi:hypothetical protein